MTLEIKIETITPDIAASILASSNTVNRKLKQKTVNTIAQDIRQGLFNGLNGETIKFGEDGQLKDGQHRLQAIVEADTPVELTVVYNVPKDSQLTVDMGVKRSYYDILHMRGEPDAAALGGIIKQVALREAGMSSNDGRMVSYMQLDRIYEKYPELRDIARESRKLYEQSRLIPVSILGLCLWAFSRINVEDASEFIARAVDGQNLEYGNPIYTLRKKLTQLREYERAPSSRTVLAYTILAWNAYRDGKELRVFKFKIGGAKPDSLPEPH